MWKKILLKFQIYSFISGVGLGLILSLLLFYPQTFNNKKIDDIDLSLINSVNFNTHKTANSSKVNLYSEDVANDLFTKVKVLCWIMTNPSNHKTKAIHVKNTWGSRCNKLLFMSSAVDSDLGTIALPVNEGRDALWDKTKHAFLYVHQHHLHEADWFLKADDDTYMIMENVRYMLSRYHHQTALYFGHRFSVQNVPEGYMSGGGYILSKKALEKFVTQVLPNGTMCRNQDGGGSEDLELGKCLKNSVLAGNEQDELNQKRMFAASVTEHLRPDKKPEYWYDKNQYFNFVQGSLDCCSKYPVGFHYIGPNEMYSIEYLTRRVFPFGFDKKINETLPKKFTFQEVLENSDIDSNSTNYQKHEKIHNFDYDEKFRK